MQTLMCPECHEVLQRTAEITAKTSKAGAIQLAKHAVERHVIPAMESMLDYTASLGVSIETLKDLTAILCPGCEQPLVEDSFRYVRKDGRTMLCCSARCQRKAQCG